jgi:hypothetical protein
VTTNKCTYQLTINPETCKVLIAKGYPKCQKCQKRMEVKECAAGSGPS